MRELLKAINLESGYSQEELSNAVGMAQPSYCNIKNRGWRLTPEIAKKLAVFLGFNWVLFFEETEKKVLRYP